MKNKVIIIGAGPPEIEALKKAGLETGTVLIRNAAEAMQELSNVMKVNIFPLANVIEEIRKINIKEPDPPRSKFIHKPRHNFKRH